MSAAFLLIPSPFLGPGSWADVAGLVPRAIAADYGTVLDGPAPFYPRIAETIAAQAAPGDVVLVAHSGAGAMLPFVAQTLGPRAKAAIFADALLPHPGRCWFDTMPPEAAGRLRGMARDNRLPRWNRWWPERVLETLLPDTQQRQRLVEALPEIPLPFLDECAPDVAPPKSLICVYQQWSAAYDGEAEAARALGWTVERLALDHLALLTRPSETARHLAKAAATLGS